MRPWGHNRSTRRRAGWASAAAVVAAGVGAVLLAAAAFAYAFSRPAATPAVRLDLALRQMVRGRPAEAVQLAAGLTPEELEATEQAKLRLLRGVVAYRAAEDAKLKSAEFTLLREAEGELAQCVEIGSPAGYDAAADFYLGMARVRLNRGGEAERLLESAIDRYPAGRFEAIHSLTQMYLDREPVDEALVGRTLERWLRLPALPAESRDLATLAAAKLKAAMGETAEAVATADTVPANSSRRAAADLLIAGEQWRDAALAAMPSGGEMEWGGIDRRKVGEVARRLRPLCAADASTPAQRMRARLLTGLCERALGRPEDAISEFVAIRTSAPQTVEAFAAAVEEIDLLVSLGRHDAAIRTLRQLAAAFGETAWYENHWRPVAGLHALLTAAAWRMLEQAAYEQAVAFSAEVLPFVTEPERLRLRAAAYHRWADRVRDATPPPTRYISTAAGRSAPEDPQARQLYAKAAAAYEQLANLQLSASDYPDLLWDAIECYSLGNGQARGNLLLERWIDLHPRDEQPKGLLRKAKNHYELGENENALAAVRRCVAASPRHPLSAEARLLATQVLLESSRFDEAAEQLTANLYESSLSPENAAWKTSLFQLGMLFCRSGEDGVARARAAYDAAQPDNRQSAMEAMKEAQPKLLQGIQRLEEAIHRYPQDPQTFYCLYRIAECYRIASDWPALQLETMPSVTAATREMYAEQRRELLSDAQLSYATLRQRLNEIGELRGMSRELQKMLRNSYLGEADLAFEMRDYEGALKAYRVAANRFLTEPTALEALAEAAKCLQRLGRGEEARRSVAQAIDLLGRIDTSDPSRFAETTRGTREEWGEYLQWLQTTIQ